MPEGNGTGRLDRIEASLQKLTRRMHEMIDHHDAEFKQMMIWQTLMQDKMDRFSADREAERVRAEAERKRLDTLWENTDKRIAELVAAIGKLIARPPETK